MYGPENEIKIPPHSHGVHCLELAGTPVATLNIPSLTVNHSFEEFNHVKIHSIKQLSPTIFKIGLKTANENGFKIEGYSCV